MDEIENPDVSAAGRAVAEDIENGVITDVQQPQKPGADTAEQLGLGQETEPPSKDLADSIFEDTQTATGNIEVNKSDLPVPNPKARNSLPARPSLKRESSAPVHQVQLSGPAQPGESSEFPQDPQDSLTLADLRRIRDGFPTAQPVKQELFPLKKVYDFEYQDTQSFPVEIEEWFSYSESERARLAGLQSAYNKLWATHTSSTEMDAPEWTESPQQIPGFIDSLLQKLQGNAEEQKTEVLQALCYIALGVWESTAGLQKENPFGTILDLEDSSAECPSQGYEHAALQMYWMIKNVCLLVNAGILPTIFETLRLACDRDL